MSGASSAVDIRAGLTPPLPAPLVDELLASYADAKQKFYEGGLRLAEVEGGRFCEAAFRILQAATRMQITPLRTPLDTENLIKQLASVPSTYSDSLRIHIPRSLRVVYDIRNKRDAAHLADGIDPNTQDATLVVSVLDWVLAEFVRLYHAVPPQKAQAIVDDLVTRRAPAVQTFGTFRKVLNPRLNAGDHVLVLLYHQGKLGASLPDLTAWARPTMRKNLVRTLAKLEHDKAFIHNEGPQYYITDAGLREVERRRLYGTVDS